MPFDSSVSLLCEAVFEECEIIVRFSLGNAYESSDEAWVDEYCFETGDRVDANDWMNSLDGLSTGDSLDGRTGSSLIEASMEG